MLHCLTLFERDMQPRLHRRPKIREKPVAETSGSSVNPGRRPRMNSPPPKSVVSELPLSWPARVGHEVICGVVAGIFCVVELLVLVTEWRTRIFSARRAPSDSVVDAGAGLGGGESVSRKNDLAA